VTALWRFLRPLAIVASVVVGVGVVVIASALGHCSAFGGRCPAEAPRLWEDDVFGTAFAGAALAVGGPVFFSKPSVRRLGVAVLWALGAALVVGFVARSAALG
jgi:hypothetical protein